MSPFWVKGDDVTSGTNARIFYGQFRVVQSQWVNMAKKVLGVKCTLSYNNLYALHVLYLHLRYMHVHVQYDYGFSESIYLLFTLLSGSCHYMYQVKSMNNNQFATASFWN